MKKYIAIFVIFALAVFLPYGEAAWADEDSEQSIHAEISLGASINGNNDSPNKASEYRSLSDEDLVGIYGGSVDVRSGKIEFGAEGMRFDSQDQEYGGHLDVDRIFELHGGYQEFLHRLGQDELLHLQATSAARGQGAQLWHSYEYAPGFDVNSNEAPDKDFGVNYEKYDATSILRLPMLPGVKVGMHYRYENREGHQQAMGMSKCGSCHVVAHDKDINETTQDYKPFVEVNLGQLSMEYSFLYRTFDNHSDHLNHRYDPAVHPFKGTWDPTTNDSYGGVNYDYRDGPLELSRTPETTKTVHHVKGKYDISKNQNVSFGYIHSFAENQSVSDYSMSKDGGSNHDLDTTYDAGMLSWTANLTRDLLVNLSGRYQMIESDSADIDLKGDSHDWTRDSDEEREVTNVRADVRYRLLHNLTLRGGYEYENEDLRNQDFIVDTNISTHKIKTKAKWRPFSSLSVTADYKFTTVDNPYTLEDAAYPTHIDLGVGDETGVWDGFICNPITGQYEVGASRTSGTYTYSEYVYGTRTHSMSADPENEHEARLKANWSPMSMLFVSAYTRYVYGENEEALEYEYKNDLLDSGVDVTVAPMDKLSMTLGYNYFRNHIDSEFYIPYYHG
ncbi:MAG: hypothetical protein LWX01_10690 [Deltaproteobacteria bacterium]|nr:hypothetical protein [Deltaproteobacteria bacterium]MDL1962142.1 hypothetical protein [Deltaproteobacteria bacterium]